MVRVAVLLTHPVFGDSRLRLTLGAKLSAAVVLTTAPALVAFALTARAMNGVETALDRMREDQLVAQSVSSEIPVDWGATVTVAERAVSRVNSFLWITGLGTLVLGAYVAQRFARRFVDRTRDLLATVNAAERSGWQPAEEPHAVDEFGDLAAACWRMAAARRQVESALREVNEGMDERVRKRTLELMEVNKQLTSQITERKAAEERLEYAATHDNLTGLPNRAMLIDRLNQCIARAGRQNNYICAILFIDLDNFKLINDSFGHDAGDELLRQAGTRLLAALRGNDSVARLGVDMAARLGGDEFVVLLDALRLKEDALRVAERIQAELALPFRLERTEVTLTGSIGVAMVQSESRAQDVLREADTAMYRAKLSGKAQHAVFDITMHEAARERLQLENELRRALELQQFALAYQPIIDLSNNQVVAFEALVRWCHPQRGVVSPAEFIPIGEETGMIVEIGRWVLDRSLRQLAEWHRNLGDILDVGVNVNVSRRQLFDRSLVAQLRDLLAELSIAPNRVRLEITESVIVTDAEMTKDALRELKELGVQIHLDDFGTGLSSLSCLMDFPLDALKIDRTFITGLRQGKAFHAVVQAVTTLAQNLGINVVAEGIEDARQLDQVRALGCGFGQGYLFSAPVPTSKTYEIMRNMAPAAVVAT